MRLYKWYIRRLGFIGFTLRICYERFLEGDVLRVWLGFWLLVVMLKPR